MNRHLIVHPLSGAAGFALHDENQLGAFEVARCWDSPTAQRLAMAYNACEGLPDEVVAVLSVGTLYERISWLRGHLRHYQDRIRVLEAVLRRYQPLPKVSHTAANDG